MPGAVLGAPWRGPIWSSLEALVWLVVRTPPLRSHCWYPVVTLPLVVVTFKPSGLIFLICKVGRECICPIFQGCGISGNEVRPPAPSSRAVSAVRSEVICPQDISQGLDTLFHCHNWGIESFGRVEAGMLLKSPAMHRTARQQRITWPSTLVPLLSQAT